MIRYSTRSKKTRPSRCHWPSGFLPLLLILLLVGCASDGSVLSGGSWQIGSLQNQHLQVLAVDPNHLQDVYAGDAQNGVFVSTDTGQTWKQSSVGLPVPLAVQALSFDTPGKKLYAATSAGLFVSANFARSWSLVARVPSDDYTALTFNINSSQVIYAATAHSGILESTDAGSNWTNITGNLPSGPISSILYNPNQNQLWAAFANALYRSDDNGATWHALSNGLPTNAGINALALGIVTGDGRSLIFAGTNHGFFITSDAGQHWVQSQLSLSKLSIRAVLLDATQPGTVYISTNIGVLRSNDSGQNWDQVGAGLPKNQPLIGLAQGGESYSQLLVVSRGVYLYPGNGTTSGPANIFPVILVLAFFALLYYLFVIRRRRLFRSSAPVLRRTTEQDESLAGNMQNGRYPSPGSVPDKKKEL